MAFDWTKIEGYREDMTADEKLALLENHEPSKPTEPTAPTAPLNLLPLLQRTPRGMFPRLSSTSWQASLPPPRRTFVPK